MKVGKEKDRAEPEVSASAVVWEGCDICSLTTQAERQFLGFH